MKTRLIHNLIIIGIFLFANTYIYAQNVPEITIKVEEAGTLSKLLGNKYKKIEKLTLSGDINASDIGVIRNMINLISLDLKDANIKEGGSFTYTRRIGGPDVFHTVTIERKTKDNIIPEEMFYRATCNKLSSVRLPNSAIKIDNYAFSNYEDKLSCLKTVILGDKVETIGGYAFSDCKNLSSVNIPPSVKYIAASAFKGCENLESITIPNGVIQIGGKIDGFLGGNTFGRCKKLNIINIPASVQFIYSGTFSECENLSEIEVDKNNTHYLSEGGFLYTIHKDSIISYTCGNKRETIYIPNSVRFIEYETFTGAKNIKNVYVNNTIPPVLNGSFDSSVEKEGTLYVPKGSYNNYWLADKWGDFMNIVETDIPTSNEIVSHINEYKIQNISNGILICTNKPINVSVYNIHGQILVNKTISKDDVMNFPKGIYIVSVDNKSYKIIIK